MISSLFYELKVQPYYNHTMHVRTIEYVATYTAMLIVSTVGT